jgi:hypothetical protein
MKNGLLIGQPDATAAGELADMVAVKRVHSEPAYKSFSCSGHRSLEQQLKGIISRRGDLQPAPVLRQEPWGGRLDCRSLLAVNYD